MELDDHGHANVFDLCESCHASIDPNGDGNVVLEREHNDEVAQEKHQAEVYQKELGAQCHAVATLTARVVWLEQGILAYQHHSGKIEQWLAAEPPGEGE